MSYVIVRKTAIPMVTKTSLIALSAIYLYVKARRRRKRAEELAQEQADAACVRCLSEFENLAIDAPPGKRSQWGVTDHPVIRDVLKRFKTYEHKLRSVDKDVRAIKRKKGKTVRHRHRHGPRRRKYYSSDSSSVTSDEDWTEGDSDLVARRSDTYRTGVTRRQRSVASRRASKSPAAVVTTTTAATPAKA